MEYERELATFVATHPGPGYRLCYHARAMQLSDFAYSLPTELIAERPAERRSASRLLCLGDAGTMPRDLHFDDLPDQLYAGDLLVFNDTKVLPARVLGHKASGGRVEFLLERRLDERRALVHGRASKGLKQGDRIRLPGDVCAQIMGRDHDLFEVEFSEEPTQFFLNHGSIPLPPYIKRQADDSDRDRYQTVFARSPGAVAAPTAALHFDQALIERLVARGIAMAYVTLHIGAGTFAPIRTQNLAEHRMHREILDVSAETCAAVMAARRAGGRVIAVGTTVVRSLESAAAKGELRPYHGETELFIRPGYRFKTIDALITNFHLSESSLLILVCAFAGRERVLAAYAHAIAARYRFFSYGDAMFLTAANTARYAI
jgi:S-adenosylmethionine:tRNA ribosyltransferase-isomerase